MNFGIIFLILGVQVVLALIVIVVLKKLLDRELIESALEQFEVLKYQGDLALLKKIDIMGHKTLADHFQTRFKSIAARKFKGVSVHFPTDSDLKGGVKIIIDITTIDCSLEDRLKKLFGPHL